VAEPDPHDEVLTAAHRRAQALANADAETLTELLHPEFVWTTHTGDVLDREAYVRRNTDGTTRWRAQHLGEPDITVVGDAAVLRATVTDEVEAGTSTMPMTQVWVRDEGRWVCVGGHAGPRLSGRLGP
jgi:ketosteroid isomerase-like protein